MIGVLDDDHTQKGMGARCRCLSTLWVNPENVFEHWRGTPFRLANLRTARYETHRGPTDPVAIPPLISYCASNRRCWQGLGRAQIGLKLIETPDVLMNTSPSGTGTRCVFNRKCMQNG